MRCVIAFTVSSRFRKKWNRMTKNITKLISSQDLIQHYQTTGLKYLQSNRHHHHHLGNVLFRDKVVDFHLRKFNPLLQEKPPEKAFHGKGQAGGSSISGGTVSLTGVENMYCQTAWCGGRSAGAALTATHYWFYTFSHLSFHLRMASVRLAGLTARSPTRGKASGFWLSWTKISYCHWRYKIVTEIRAASATRWKRMRLPYQ